MGQAAVRLGPSGAALRQKAPPTVPFGHLVRNALVIAPLVLCAAGIWRGGHGAGSAAFGLALAGARLRFPAPVHGKRNHLLQIPNEGILSSPVPVC